MPCIAVLLLLTSVGPGCPPEVMPVEVPDLLLAADRADVLPEDADDNRRPEVGSTALPR